MGEHLRPSPPRLRGASGPPYYRDLNQALTTAIPHATLLPLEGHGHDGINRAPAKLTDAYATFLT